MRYAVWLSEVDADHISDVVLAVDEAVSNAIEHAGISEAAVITVQASVLGTTLHFEISDDGVWKEPTFSETRWRGLAIMNSLMDVVKVEHGDNDTRVVMSRQVHATRL